MPYSSPLQEFPRSFILNIEQYKYMVRADLAHHARQICVSNLHSTKYDQELPNRLLMLFQRSGGWSVGRLQLEIEMGCTPSQSSNCIIVGQRNNSSSAEDNRKSTPKESMICNSAFEKKYYLEEDTDSKNEYLQESMKSNNSELSSKSSCDSWDSGVCELDKDYSHVITENSDPIKVQEVDSQFVPKDNLELLVEGKACPTRLSARDRDFKEQEAILELLREEGLIVRPPAKSVGGMRFELVSALQSPANESSLARKLPPLNIRRKQKKVELTHEEIQQKLIKAEERRKKKTEERLSKMVIKNPQEIQTTAQQQAEKNKQKIEKKLQASTQSREKYLNEVQEKLKAREEHAKRVRERKQMIASGFKYVSPSEIDKKLN